MAYYDWQRIRTQYESGAYSISQLAREHGCSRASIQKHLKNEKWQLNPSRQIAIATASKVAGVSAATSAKERADIVDKVADEAAEVIKRHRQEWQQVREILGDALSSRAKFKRFWDEGKGDAAAGEAKLSELHFKQAKQMADVLVAQQNGERRAWNLDELSAPPPAPPATEEDLALLAEYLEVKA